MIKGLFEEVEENLKQTQLLGHVKGLSEGITRAKSKGWK